MKDLMNYINTPVNTLNTARVVEMQTELIAAFVAASREKLKERKETLNFETPIKYEADSLNEQDESMDVEVEVDSDSFDEKAERFGHRRK
jgi:hypothetical protein